MLYSVRGIMPMPRGACPCATAVGRPQTAHGPLLARHAHAHAMAHAHMKMPTAKHIRGACAHYSK